MTIDEIRQLMNYVARKNNTGGFLSTTQFNLVVNRASITKFMQLYGNPHEYQPGRPIPRIAFELTQKVLDDLKVFKEPEDIFIDEFGQFPFPSDFVHPISLVYIAGKDTGKKDTDGLSIYTTLPTAIEFVEEQFEWYRRGSKIVPPDKENPIVIEKNTYFQFYPENLSTARLWYLRQPKKVEWGFDVSNSREVYNASKSTQLEWPDVVHNDIVVLALSYVGISIDKGSLMQYTELQEQKGK